MRLGSTSAAFARVETQSAAFASGTAPSALTTSGWSTHEWVHFLQSLPAELSDAQLARLDDAFRFSATGNSEIRFGWLRVAIRNEYNPAIPSLRGVPDQPGTAQVFLPVLLRPRRLGLGPPARAAHLPRGPPGLPLGHDRQRRRRARRALGRVRTTAMRTIGLARREQASQPVRRSEPSGLNDLQTLLDRRQDVARTRRAR